MAETTTLLVGVFAGHVVEVMMDVFLLLETVASLKEIGVKHHLDATLMQIVQGVFQGLLEEFIGDGVVTRGHDGEVHLIGRCPQLPVDEGHETQHDVVVMRTSVIDHLVLEEPGATPELGFHGGDDLLHPIEAEVGNAGTTGVVLQVFQRQLMGITVDNLAEAEHSMFGLLKGPWTVKVSRISFVKHFLVICEIADQVRNDIVPKESLRAQTRNLLNPENQSLLKISLV